MEWIVEAECREDLVDGHWFGGEELVRCKDCNRAEEVEVFPCVKAQYHIACPLYHNMIFANEHYCAWGERKDDADN